MKIFTFRPLFSILSFFLLGIEGLLIAYLDPTMLYMIGGLALSPLLPFLLLLPILIFSVGMSFLKEKRHALILSALITSIALLFYFQQRSLLYIGILIAIAVLIEFLFRSKQN